MYNMFLHLLAKLNIGLIDQIKMFFLDKIFSSKSQPQKKSKGLYIYLDTQLKRKIETHNQTASQYMSDNQFDSDQFLYLLLKTRKNDQVYSKRKLNPYEWLSDCIQAVPEQYKCYIVMGYNSQRSSTTRISSSLPISDNPKCIRSGNLQMYSDSKSAFEECQLRLHHDYLTYYKMKSKEKKVSFMPLENSVVETMSENKYVFIVKDKFKSIVFKTTSKEDMIGWLLAISQAIKIRSSQIYLNQFDEKLAKSIKQRIGAYTNKCQSLKEPSKIILLDQIGRKALKGYIKKHKAPEIDFKMLSIIQAYLQMCKIRREKGESQSQMMMGPIKESIKEVFAVLPQQFKSRQLNSNHQFIKVIEEIMKYLDTKYKKQIIDKKYLNHIFQHHLTDQYRKNSKIPMKSLFGHVEVNQNLQEINNKQNNLHLSSSSLSNVDLQSPLRRIN